MSDNTVTLTIDGQPVEATAGETIMRAADRAGIYIPRLCYHKDLPPGGHCRLCTVLVNGRPSSACTFPASHGQVVENNTETLKANRRNIVEMLFVEGNHNCPVCEASGNCDLQAMGYRLGLLTPQLPYLRIPRALDASHPDVYIDRDRCILCGRCVRASRMLDGKNVFGFENRGIGQRISVDGEHGLSETELEATDQAAQLCPTGCIVIKRRGFATPVGRRRYDHTPIGSDIEQNAAGVHR